MNKELRNIFNEATSETEKIATEYLEAAYGIEENSTWVPQDESEGQGAGYKAGYKDGEKYQNYDFETETPKFKSMYEIGYEIPDDIKDREAYEKGFIEYYNDGYRQACDDGLADDYSEETNNDQDYNGGYEDGVLDFYNDKDYDTDEEGLTDSYKAGYKAGYNANNQEEIDEDIVDEGYDKVESINGPTFNVKGYAGDYMGARNLLKGVSAEEVLDEVEELLEEDRKSVV